MGALGEVVSRRSPKPKSGVRSPQRPKEDNSQPSTQLRIVCQPKLIFDTTRFGESFFSSIARMRYISCTTVLFPGENERSPVWKRACDRRGPRIVAHCVGPPI